MLPLLLLGWALCTQKTYTGLCSKHCNEFLIEVLHPMQHRTQQRNDGHLLCFLPAVSMVVPVFQRRIPTLTRTSSNASHVYTQAVWGPDLEFSAGRTWFLVTTVSGLLDSDYLGPSLTQTVYVFCCGGKSLFKRELVAPDTRKKACKTLYLGLVRQPLMGPNRGENNAHAHYPDSIGSKLGYTNSVPVASFWGLWNISLCKMNWTRHFPWNSCLLYFSGGPTEELSDAENMNWTKTLHMIYSASSIAHNLPQKLLWGVLKLHSRIKAMDWQNQCE